MVAAAKCPAVHLIFGLLWNERQTRKLITRMLDTCAEVVIVVEPSAWLAGMDRVGTSASGQIMPSFLPAVD
eukprot:1254557-Ditylum_brightwellii.AAC.1